MRVDLLPTGVGAQGRLGVTLDLSRPSIPGPLRAEAHVEARNLSGGLRLAGRLVPAVVPLTLRAVGCTELQGAAIDGSNARLRVALTPWHSGDAEPAERPCGNEEPLLSRSFAAVDWSVRGPWLSAALAALDELRTPTRPLSAATQTKLAATHVDLRVKLGPMLRAEWPLRAVPVRGADGRPRMLQPPDLPADAMLLVETTAAGPALGLGVDAGRPRQRAAADRPRRAHLGAPHLVATRRARHPPRRGRGRARRRHRAVAQRARRGPRGSSR